MSSATHHIEDGRPSRWLEEHRIEGKGPRLFLRHWRTQPAKGTIVLVHGMSEHGGRYSHFARACGEAGLELIVADLRGHGASEGHRVYVRRFGEFLDDLDRVMRFAAAKRASESPCVLFGHSLGGLIAVRYIETRQPSLAGLVTTGAGLKATIAPPKPVFELLRLANRLYDRLPLPGLIDPNYLSRDPEVAERFTKDPLVTRGLTTQLGLAASLEMPVAIEQATRISCPTLVLHGGADRVVDKSASEALYAQLQVTNKRLRIYPGAYHELLNDINRDEVIGDIIAFCHALGTPC